MGLDGTKIIDYHLIAMDDRDNDQNAAELNHELHELCISGLRWALREGMPKAEFDALCYQCGIGKKEIAWLSILD